MVKSYLQEIISILIIVGIYYLKEWRDKRKSKKINSYVGSATRAQETHALLEGVRVHYRADWAFYGNFHNGKSYSDGRSFKEFSIQYIRTGKTAKPFEWPRSCSQIPLAAGMEIFGVIKDGNVYSGENFLDSDDSDFFNNMFKINEIKSVIVAPVFRNKDLYGFVGVTWNSDFNSPERKDESYLLTTAIRLSKYNLRLNPR